MCEYHFSWTKANYKILTELFFKLSKEKKINRTIFRTFERKKKCQQKKRVVKGEISFSGIGETITSAF